MRNKQLAEKFRGLPCIVCFRSGEGDHILNYAGDPDKDVEENIWCLCRAHHIEKGTIGLGAFVLAYNLKDELLSRGYWFDGFKWRKHF
jgi:hypothetical protein